jgi:crotonobetainyl-CoA:carnitine CoA-transferase CaiB-like acyl-CoA transferase
MKAVLEEALQSKSAEEWETLFDQAGVPAGRIFTVPEIVRHPQLQTREFFKHFDEVPGADRAIDVPRLGFRLASGLPDVRTPPPRLGQNTGDILENLGYSAAEIAGLRSDGII